MQVGILEGVVILLMGALIITTLFRRFHLPPILGYLLVGVIVGPYGAALIADTEASRELAEYGVVFLMFTIGLEFSLHKLMSMKHIVLGLGGLQVFITTGIVLGIALLFGIPMTGALVIGGVIAMSSTAIAIKQLHDQNELNLSHGFNALGILLFQDIAVVAFLILVPSLAGGSQAILILLLGALAKAGVVFVGILLFGRLFLRPLFREIAMTQSLELFTLAILLVTLGSAWLTEHMGLSLALGAFLAGMMLGETQYRHQIEIEIRPFRDVLLGLFFITIGMLLNLKVLPHIWLDVAMVLFSIIIIKMLLIMGLSLLMGNNKVIALRTGLVLAQGGEFSFALLALAINHHLLEAKPAQIMLAALIFSMALAPFLIRFNQRIAERFFPNAVRLSSQEIQQSIESSAKDLTNHVIICGYGRVGQNIARFLEQEGFEFIALDMDPIRVEDAQLAGDNVTYGDSKHISMLHAAGLNRAKALIISFYDIETAYKILHQVRKQHKDIPILVRTDDDQSLDELLKAGATEVVPETLEASLMLAFQTLVLLGTPASRALRLIRDVRKNRYELLHRIFPSHDIEDIEDLESERDQLAVLNVPPGSSCIDRTLGDLDLGSLDVKATAICRDGIKRPDPDEDTTLKIGDVLVLLGTQSAIERVERSLQESSTD